MRRSILLLVAAAVAAQAAGTSPADAAQLWVGNGGVAPCTHATLQAAIDAAQGTAGHDFIFLVGAGPFDPSFIVGGELHIRGGVGFCGDFVSRGYATVRAPSGSRPLSILMGGAANVTLERLLVTTQQGTLNNDGGAIWFSGGGLGSSLSLEDCQVIDSIALGDGGGIYVSNASLSLGRFTRVSGNAAANGGGIAAEAGSMVLVYDGAMVASNTAFFDGGGLHMVGATIQLGTTSPGSAGPIPPPLVVSNIAGDEGGGLYLADSWGTSYVLAAADAPPVGIGGNQAGRGGGIFVSHSVLRLERAELYLNSAAQGGGACVVAEAEITANHTVGLPLTGELPRFSGNDATRGSSLFVDRGRVFLGAGAFLDHDAGTGDATVSATGLTILQLTGVAFARNQVPALIALEEGVNLALTHVSIGGNEVDGLVDWQGSLTTVQVAASALDETEPFFARVGTPQVPPVFDCVLTRHGSTLQGMPLGTDLSGIVFGDPGFLAPQSADLHIHAASPAIDLCPDLTDSTHDLDGEVRGFDFEGPPTPAGRLWDAGADEHTSFPGRFFTVTACRAFDSRPGPPLEHLLARTVVLREVCGIPHTARAVALNVTVVGPTGVGHVTLYPAGIAPPSTSTVNFGAGQTRANNAVLALPATGKMEARAVVPPGGKLHLVVDVSGYFE